MPRIPKKRYYAVVNGRQPGIYESWSECQPQVHRFQGNDYKSFDTLHDAQAYVSNEQNKMRTSAIGNVHVTGLRPSSPIQVHSPSDDDAIVDRLSAATNDDRAELPIRRQERLEAAPLQVSDILIRCSDPIISTDGPAELVCYCQSCQQPIDTGTTCNDCWQALELCARDYDEEQSGIPSLSYCAGCRLVNVDPLDGDICDACLMRAVSQSDSVTPKSSNIETAAASATLVDDDDDESVMVVAVESPARVWKRKLQEAESRGEVCYVFSQESTNDGDVATVVSNYA